jgi:hypothetical protein
VVTDLTNSADGRRSVVSVDFHGPVLATDRIADGVGRVVRGLIFVQGSPACSLSGTLGVDNTSARIEPFQPHRRRRGVDGRKISRFENSGERGSEISPTVLGWTDESGDVSHTVSLRRNAEALPCMSHQRSHQWRDQRQKPRTGGYEHQDHLRRAARQPFDWSREIYAQ